MRYALAVAVRGAGLSGGRICTRDADLRLARDAVTSRQASASRRAALRPDGHDHATGDRGVHCRRAQGLRPGSVDRRRARCPRSTHGAAPQRGVHGALACDLGRRSHWLGRLHLRHRRHAAAADRGLRLDGTGVDGRRGEVGVLRLARACSSARSDSGFSFCESRSHRGSRTGSTGRCCRRDRRPQRRYRRVRDAGGDALQVPFVDLLYGDLSPLATKTRFGVAFVAMTLGYAIVTALVLLAWILDRPRLLWPAFLIGIGFASGLSLSGHQGVEPNSTFLTGLADWLHLVAAILWVGGLVALAACVWPLAPTLRRSAFLGFSRIATVLVAVLVLAGTYLSISRLPALSDLWTTHLRPCPARQDRDRLRRARLGCGASLRRAAAARAGRGAGDVAAEPDRREHGRDARAARRRGARQRAPSSG